MCLASPDFAWTDLLPTVVAGILAASQWYWNAKIKERDARIDLSKRLENILRITIAYPELEHKSITEQWNANKDSMDENFMRYDQFCNILFNFLEEVYTHFKGDKKSIENFVDIKTWVRIHRQIWNNPLDPNENVDGYSKEFRDFIDSYVH